jgi:hypothetical protein
MLRTVREVLCAAGRNRILLGIAAALVVLSVIIILLEISYRDQVARNAAVLVTGSLPSLPPARPPALQLESAHSQVTPLAPAPPAALLAPPPATAPATDPTQKPTQSVVVTRDDPIPLPRSRPNRF